MRILLLHNKYQRRGGEDAVVEAEAKLLSEANHDVLLEIVNNDHVNGVISKARTALLTHGNQDQATRIAGLVRRAKADVVHVHNFFPLLSPAVHVAAAREGAAVVQTLHNYRLLCANGTLSRNGQVCEKCVNGSRLWAVYHRCYRDSAIGSAAVTSMQASSMGSARWLQSVHRFIALSEFGRKKFASAGLPLEKITVKPNFTEPSPFAMRSDRRGALYVGRLSVEKGVDTLLAAWRELPDTPLTIIGDGPERSRLESLAPPAVTFCGEQPREVVLRTMNSASLLVVPSTWFEGFPMVIAEAFASGLPVLASDIGALAEIVRPGVNGAHFSAGDARSLAEALRTLLSDRAMLAQLSFGAARSFEERYSPRASLDALEGIYADAIEVARRTPLDTRKSGDPINVS